MNKSVMTILAILGGGFFAYKIWLKPKIEAQKAMAVPQDKEEAKMQVLQTKIAAYKDDAQKKFDEFMKKKTG